MPHFSCFLYFFLSLLTQSLMTVSACSHMLHILKLMFGHGKIWELRLWYRTRTSFLTATTQRYFPTVVWHVSEAVKLMFSRIPTG